VSPSFYSRYSFIPEGFSQPFSDPVLSEKKRAHQFAGRVSLYHQLAIMAPAKAKPQKMSIGTFLADENFGSWADEMEDMPLTSAPDSRTSYGGDRRAVSTSAAGYGNGIGDRDRSGYSQRPELPLPTQPPYTAHIGNLSFDATSEDISKLFIECQVTNVRIVEDKSTRTPKGFGYVEFANVDGLKKSTYIFGYYDSRASY
jgi:translation initiation factor 4B